MHGSKLLHSCRNTLLVASAVSKTPDYSGSQDCLLLKRAPPINVKSGLPIRTSTLKSGMCLKLMNRHC